MYCEQLIKLATKIIEKRPKFGNQKGIVFHQDKVKSNISLVT